MVQLGITMYKCPYFQPKKTLGLNEKKCEHFLKENHSTFFPSTVIILPGSAAAER